MAYEPKAVRGLGWTLVSLGFASVLIGVAADINFAARGVWDLTAHFASAPIWSGLFVIVTGILGISSAKKPTNRCLIVAVMVLAILVILTCLACIVIGAFGILLHPFVVSCTHYDNDAYHAARRRHEENPTPSGDGPDWREFLTYDCTPEALGLYAAAIFLALVEMILGFVVSIMSCCGLCTMRRDAGQTVMYATGPAAGSPQGGVLIIQGQPAGVAVP